MLLVIIEAPTSGQGEARLPARVWWALLSSSDSLDAHAQRGWPGTCIRPPPMPQQSPGQPGPRLSEKAH